MMRRCEAISSAEFGCEMKPPVEWALEDIQWYFDQRCCSFLLSSCDQQRRRGRVFGRCDPSGGLDQPFWTFTADHHAIFARFIRIISSDHFFGSSVRIICLDHLIAKSRPGMDYAACGPTMQLGKDILRRSRTTEDAVCVEKQSLPGLKFVRISLVTAFELAGLNSVGDLSTLHID